MRSSPTSPSTRPPIRLPRASFRRWTTCSTACCRSSRNPEASAMTRIATAAENQLVLYYMQLNQSAANDLNTQISTGLKGQTYEQIAPQANQLVDFRTEA